MEYLLKASAVLGMFYLIYMLWLQKETFFNSNRWFLLSGLILSAVLPLIIIPIYVAQEPTTLDLSQFITSESTAPEEAISYFSWLNLAIVVYLLGVLFFSIRFIIECISLKTFINSQNIKLDHGFKISETNQEVSPFSFFKTIVYNPSQFTASELNHIINHEKVHARDYHTIDILLSKLATIAFWCNPLVWLYKNALIQNLEFLADYKSIPKTKNATVTSYQNILLKTSVPSHQLALTTNFYNSLIKKRILMLNTSKSKPIHALKYMVIAPLLAAFLMSFNTKTVYTQVQNQELESATIKSEINTIINKDTPDSTFESLENMFESMDVDLKINKVKRNTANEIIAISIKSKTETDEVNYKTDADTPISPINISYQYETKLMSINVVQNNKEVMFTSSKNASQVNHKNSFIIPTSDGSSIVIKSSGEEYNDENVMFISEDGKTTYVTLKNTDQSSQQDKKTYGINSVTFTDEDGKTTDLTDSTKARMNSNRKEGYEYHISETVFMDEDGTTTRTVYPPQGNPSTYTLTDPIYILNGKEISKDEMNKIAPENIDSVFVLKGEKAIEKYGEKGKHGVVVITTKPKDAIKVRATKASPKTVLESSSKNPPLAFLNGKEISREEMEAIDPDTIDNIMVLKDEKAIEKYGDKGKHGVLEITTKSSKTNSNPWEISAGVTEVFTIEHSENPIYFIDGKEAKGVKIEDIDPGTIESVNVLKDEKAIEKYGDRAKDDVIEITLKK
ncbi:M56 family metallopeptidase [Formosa haliotis]|uniref:M56 family metallopeptidase n=1 Tax=Formosa haliotis TaxID=1555194 RepID=UPI000825867E|nr:M56 family metallopeptidase [Formosa haliotis]